MNADLSRTFLARQTHRRMVDPMSLRRWDRPFVIERADPLPNPRNQKLSEER